DLSTNSGFSGQSFALFNVGNDRFSIPFGTNVGPTLTGDVNNDGRSDLVFLSGGTITALLGQANSTFATVTTSLRYPTQAIAALGDFNNDGKVDLLAFEYPNLRIWLGNGDGTFTSSNLVSSGATYPQSAFVIADFDGDGNADIVGF